VFVLEAKRYLVIGSTNYSPAESVPWDVGELPNIVDYDVVILDVRALNEELLPAVSNERLEILRKQFVRLLDSQGSLIVLSDFRKWHERPERYPKSASNYDWSPVHMGLADESGESLEVLQKRFPSYLQLLCRWPYYFFLSRGYLSTELTDFCGSTHDTRYKANIEPFIVNRYGKAIAGSLQIEITHQRTGNKGWGSYDYYPEDPDKTTGEIVLLPLIEELDHREAVRLILQDLTGVETTTELPPEWAESIGVPGVASIEDKIANNAGEIEVIQAQIDNLKGEQASLEKYRKLLYASGTELEEIVRECLEMLGGQVTPAQYGQEEFVLVFEEHECLIEVKGVGKSISLGDVRQLNDYLLQCEEKTGKPPKGILFGNAWRNDPPEDRDSNDKPEFPQNVVDRAIQYRIALVSSREFFVVFCHFLQDRTLGTNILLQIIETAGIVNFALEDSTEQEGSQ